MCLKFGEKMRKIAAGNGGFGTLIVVLSSLCLMRQCVNDLHMADEIGEDSDGNVTKDAEIYNNDDGSLSTS